MENEIDWDRVPEDRVEEARLLDERLEIYESGFYYNYGNKVASITVMSSLILDYPHFLEETFSVMRRQFQYLDAVYEELDFEEIPLTEDTKHYFNCRDLYPDFRNAFGTLEKQVGNGQDIEYSLKELKELSLEIADKMDVSLYAGMYLEIIKPLNEIPGCENRYIHRKIPKNYKFLINH